MSQQKKEKLSALDKSLKIPEFRIFYLVGLASGQVRVGNNEAALKTLDEIFHLLQKLNIKSF